MQKARNKHILPPLTLTSYLFLFYIIDTNSQRPHKTWMCLFLRIKTRWNKSQDVFYEWIFWALIYSCIINCSINEQIDKIINAPNGTLSKECNMAKCQSNFTWWQNPSNKRKRTKIRLLLDTIYLIATIEWMYTPMNYDQ